MRVLFVSGAAAPDYQCDMLLHGLRELLGPDVVDVQRVWYLYAGDFVGQPQSKATLYGRGFTMYGLLGDDADVDRSDIAAKIAARYFDLIIYGSIHRCLDHLDSVLMHYPPGNVVFVDGEDEQSLMTTLVGRGVYFKRELILESPTVRPIQFAIPAAKIGTIEAGKTKVRAHIDPRDRSTYIYDTESGYYTDYAESLFGFTQKKAGWDCLRHYEILANRCIPDFEDIAACPISTMVFLPKYELSVASRLLADKGEAYFQTAAGRADWEGLNASIDGWLHRHLTTTALARYVLETVTSANAGRSAGLRLDGRS